MTVYWPVGVQKEGTYDSFWGKEQNTYVSCTSWEEVVEVFETWMFDIGLEFEDLYVDVVNYDTNERVRHRVNFVPNYILGEVIEDENLG